MNISSEAGADRPALRPDGLRPRQDGRTGVPEVSLLGLGRMGEPIARRLLTALGSLTVWNRTAAKAATLGQAGARVAASPAQAAAPITLSVLTDLADVQDVLDGDEGLMAGWAAIGVRRPIAVAVAGLAGRHACDRR